MLKVGRYLDFFINRLPLSKWWKLVKAPLDNGRPFWPRWATPPLSPWLMRCTLQGLGCMDMKKPTLYLEMMITDFSQAHLMSSSPVMVWWQTLDSQSLCLGNTLSKIYMAWWFCKTNPFSQGPLSGSMHFLFFVGCFIRYILISTYKFNTKHVPVISLWIWGLQTCFQKVLRTWESLVFAQLVTLPLNRGWYFFEFTVSLETTELKMGWVGQVTFDRL